MTRTCAYKPCAKTFTPTYPKRKFCCRACSLADLRERYHTPRLNWQQDRKPFWGWEKHKTL